MIDYPFFYNIIILETLFIARLLFIIILFRVMHFCFRKRRQRQAKELSDFVAHQIETKGATTPDKTYDIAALLAVLENYDHRLIGEDWERVKRSIALPLLLPRARKRWKSIFWYRRALAARSFALYAEKEDEPKILQLIDDPNFLVRGYAAKAAVRMESPAGVRKILEHMVNEFGYSYFFFRDTLAKGSKPVFQLVIDFAADPKIHAACLAVLATRCITLPIPFLQTDLVSRSLAMRFLALRVLIRNPTADCALLLRQCFQDVNEDLRAVAAEGLAVYPSEQNIALLQRALVDPSWKVRVAAGKALKTIGPAGETVLHAQDAQTSPLAYETAQYALQFG